jgi:formylglycine-generating enzyme required for sulfatase activity
MNMFEELQIRHVGRRLAQLRTLLTGGLCSLLTLVGTMTAPQFSSARAVWIGIDARNASVIPIIRTPGTLPKASVVRTFSDCQKCPEMIVLPEGFFVMGSPVNEEGRFKDEGPQHLVTISKRVAVSRAPVTVDQFSEFVTETGHQAGSKCYTLLHGNWSEARGYYWRHPGFAQDGSHPVVCVSWNDAKAYTDWISRKTDKPYRLLSEAEWEYAARGGRTTRFYFGDEDSTFCNFGNGADQTAKRAYPSWTVLPCDDGYLYTAPVGHFMENPFGLQDMLGNAWQWVEDCYNETYVGAPVDGTAWKSGDCSSHVLRGGSWGSNPRHLRTAVRIGGNPDIRSNSRVSFRVATSVSP